MKLIALLALGSISAAGLFAGTAGTTADVETYAVDTTHSAVLFRIKHLNASNFYGRFNDFDGRITFGEGDDAANQIEVTVKAESVDTNNDGRDKHLRSPDFLNVKQFPTISFKSKSFKKEGTGKYKVTGDLTLHGVTKEITADLTHVGTSEGERFGKRCGFEAIFDIKRSDYGIKYMPEGLGEDIRLLVALEGMKK